jgi:putative spermidine/putrescine transport system ATP-binding protein
LTAVRIDGVARAFGPVAAVRGVSLDVGDGELFTLLGPSGCGKTTLLRMVAGFCELDRGAIWFGERRIDGLPPHRRNTGMVFQNYAIFPNLTVAGNVAYGLKARRTPRDEIIARVARALRLVQLEGYGERWPHQLSGGQLQRIAIARCLVIEPEVLLLDEPLSNLDARLRVETRAEIRRLQQKLCITALYVTHDQEEALAISDRIAVMRAGAVEQVGTPIEVYRRPATPFVAEFVGLNNKVPAEVSADQARLLGTSVPALPGSIGSGGGLAMVRPESVTVTADPAGTASVTSVAFLGPISRVFCTLADGTVVSAQMTSSAARAFGPGDRVTVGVEPTGVLVVAAAG